MVEEPSVDYGLLHKQLDELIKDEPDVLANSANFVAMLFDEMPDINWLGIYVIRDEELVLGPFQGRPACVRIRIGQGVCGTAALERASLIVPDVHAFEGHVVCDPASKSEIVVPLIAGDRLLGVLDIDSPQLSRFNESDRKGLESLCDAFVQHLEQGGRFI
jgi:L-methionine (R)-S-oxide reductase